MSQKISKKFVIMRYVRNKKHLRQNKTILFKIVEKDYKNLESVQMFWLYFDLIIKSHNLISFMLRLEASRTPFGGWAIFKTRCSANDVRHQFCLSKWPSLYHVIHFYNRDYYDVMYHASCILHLSWHMTLWNIISWNMMPWKMTSWNMTSWEK